MPENNFLCVDITPAARQAITLKPFVGASSDAGKHRARPALPAKDTLRPAKNRPTGPAAVAAVSRKLSPNNGRRGGSYKL
jgi:hypothetical protein